MNLENSNSYWINTYLDLQMMSETYAQVEVIKWLDNDNVFVEFSYPPDESGNVIHGTLIFENGFENGLGRTIKELTILN